MSDLKTRGLQAFAWDIVGRLSSHGVSFFITILLARILEPEEFGLIAMVMVFVSMANVFIDVGLGGAIIQRENIQAIHYSSAFYFNILIGSVLSVIIFSLAGVVGEFYDQPALVPITEVLACSFFFNSLASTQTTKLRRELKYSIIARANVLSSLLSGLLGLGMALSGFGIWSLVAQTLGFGVFYNLFIWTAAKWRPELKFSLAALSQLWTVGFRLFLAGALDALFSRLDYLVIGKLLSPTTVGFYFRAKSINSLIAQYASGSLAAVLFPVLSAIQTDLPRVRKIVVNMMAIIGFTTFLLIGGLYLVSEELILIIFGSKWLVTASYFKVMVLSSFSYPLSSLLVNVLRSLGNSRLYLRLEIYKKTLLIVNLVVLSVFGLQVFLFGLIIKSLLGCSINLFYACREINISASSLGMMLVQQASIAIFSVFVVLAAVEPCALGLFSCLFVKSTLFTLLYVCLSMALKTRGFKASLAQVKLAITRA